MSIIIIIILITKIMLIHDNRNNNQSDFYLELCLMFSSSKFIISYLIFIKERKREREWGRGREN